MTGLIATPALARDSMNNRAQVTQEYSATNVGYRDRDNYGYRDNGFWPGDVAAGVVGGAVGIAGAAVGTAGEIAAAPFQPWGNSYNSSAPPRDSYAQRMGFVCQPGTWFRGEDGRRHICQ
jgi:hypothetical protein